MFFSDKLEFCNLLGVKYAINSIFCAVSNIPACYLRLFYKLKFLCVFDLYSIGPQFTITYSYRN